MLKSWVESSSRRIFPGSLPKPSLRQGLDVACNERFSFQVAARHEGDKAFEIAVEVPKLTGWKVQVRRVGYVPVRHLNSDAPRETEEVEGLGAIPGFVPDPLFEETMVLLPPLETHAFWFTVTPTGRGKAGRRSLEIAIRVDGKTVRSHRVGFHVHDLVLPRRKGFAMTHWFYVDALMDWYKTDHFDERFWTLLEAYFRNMTVHGLDKILVPVFTPPLDGVKRPSQLLKVRGNHSDGYEFDWSDVHRYVTLARECGFQNFEWSHFFTQWGAKQAIRIYQGQGEDEEDLLWPPETLATSEVYRRFLGLFLPELYRFLTTERLLKCSLFHISDEPHKEHIESYAAAKEILHEHAPWMKIMDAISEVDFAKTKLTNIPVAPIYKSETFLKAGIPCWVYYCCDPKGRFLNRFIDTPLAKIAMHGVLFYRWPFGGFLHWGHNYWYKSQTRTLIDPFTVQDAGRWPYWAYGDPFVVYPGDDGPIDSIRWEIFAESLQDFALLQALQIDRNDVLLKAIRSFEDFPKDEGWRRRLRSTLFAIHEKS